MSAPTKTDYTPEDLLAMQDGDRYELVDGRLVDRHRTGTGREGDQARGWLSDLVATRLAARLTVFCDERRLGFVVISNSGGFQCGGRKVRKPDVSFVGRGRLPTGERGARLPLSGDGPVPHSCAGARRCAVERER